MSPDPKRGKEPAEGSREADDEAPLQRPDSHQGVTTGPAEEEQRQRDKLPPRREHKVE